MSIIFTKLIPQRAIWGGKALGQAFHRGDELPDGTGQAWAFSGQKGKSSLLRGGGFDGYTLDELWKTHPELFRSDKAEFPFIISLVAPEDDLSIQVHPDDENARKAGYAMGKSEAWVFLRGPERGDIVYGHHAKDEQELRDYIAHEEWAALAGRLPVQTGDAVWIPAGTLHALAKGSVVYEIQQATDVTYRFYDYGRLDGQGQPRPLHLAQAIGCMHYEPVDAPIAKQEEIIRHGEVTETVRIRQTPLTVRQVNVDGEGSVAWSIYQLCTVTAGEGAAQGIPVALGDSFLLPAGEALALQGCMTLMLTSER